MNELEAINALIALTRVGMELMAAGNAAAQAIQARQARGGDFTPEELAAVQRALDLSAQTRDASIAKREVTGG